MFVTRQGLTKMPDNQGRLSPFTSSSSQHDEVNDNHVEYYVRTSGGEDKMLDVNSSETVDRGYDHSTSTEPDPTGTIAMQKEVSKGATYTEPAELDGVGKYSTTANSTVDAPAAGDTTEPETVHKAASCVCKCENCQKCAGMMMKSDSCDCCSDCGSDCGGDCCDECSMTSKAVESDDLEKSGMPEDEETEADEPDNDADDKEVKKSIWGNAFAPGVPTAAMRSVFRIEG